MNPQSVATTQAVELQRAASVAGLQQAAAHGYADAARARIAATGI
ncbi:hypothetical protein [Burkholderia sp.]|jgi:hypothetical protein|nr:hypothetical protein [Burkholderia sp.]